MHKIYINKYWAFLIVALFGAFATNLIVHTIHLISETTPQALATNWEN